MKTLGIGVFWRWTIAAWWIGFGLTFGVITALELVAELRFIFPQLFNLIHALP